MLVEDSYECHSREAAGNGSLKGGLQLDTREGIRLGGEKRPAVVPSSVEESLLVSALNYESFEMPPAGKLEDDVIADFIKWIEMGVPDPRGPGQSPVLWAGSTSMRAANSGRFNHSNRWPYQSSKMSLGYGRRKIASSSLDRRSRPASQRACARQGRSFDGPTLIWWVSLLTGRGRTVRPGSRRRFRLGLEYVDRRPPEQSTLPRAWGRHWMDIARFESRADTSRTTIGQTPITIATFLSRPLTPTCRMTRSSVGNWQEMKWRRTIRWR